MQTLSFGFKLRELREASGVSRRDLAARARRTRAEAGKIAAPKMSAARQGVPLHEWQGFSISAWRHFKDLPEYKAWRRAVYRRDGFRCVDCGKQKSGSLEAHHIFRKSLFPHLALEKGNGVTLCKDCHTAIYGQEEQKAVRYLAKIGSTVAPLVWFDAWPDLV